MECVGERAGKVRGREEWKKSSVVKRVGKRTRSGSNPKLAVLAQCEHAADSV